MKLLGTLTDKKLNSLDINALNKGVKGERFPIAENLYLFVTTKNKKRWEYRYKTLKGTYTFKKLGYLSDLTVAQAIMSVERKNALLAKGIDPFQEESISLGSFGQRNLGTRKTFKEVYEEFCEFKRAYAWKEGTLHKHNLRFGKHVLPFVGDKYMDEVKVDDLVGVLITIQDQGVLNVRDKVLNTLKGMYEWAMANKYQNGKPFTDLNYAIMVPTALFHPKKNKNFRHVTTDKQYEQLVKKVYGMTSKSEVKACLRIALHLFTRPGEIVGLKWAQICFKENEIYLSADQMKMKRDFVIPISNQVLNELLALKEVSGHSDYVFLSTYRAGDRKPIAMETLTSALKRNGIMEASAHGFRHCASTLLRDELGHADAEVEAQLSHHIRGVNGIYNKAQYIKVRAPMMQDWSNYIEKLLAR